jgi:insulysin
MVDDACDEPLLLSVNESSSVWSLSARRARSFWIFVILSVGVLGFLVYSTYLIVYDTITGNYGWYDIDKPNNDPKIYKFLPELLPNAPPIVVVQDPGAQLSGFAIGVSAGSFNDPIDFPGLAHFTEHMLFLGTSKYPGPTSFDEFISSHGGSSNAFTDSERTVYYNAIDTDAFVEGFSRFIEFFTDPLFNETYIAKEVKAVDSEHDMHINDPNWRLSSLVNSLALPPNNHYSTGDSTTLLHSGVEALETAVRKYFSTNYCFNRLSIAIVSPLAVSDQVEAVRDVFSGISSKMPSNCRSATNFTRASPQLIESNGYPIPPSNRHKIVYSEAPSGSQPLLWIAFPFRSVSTRGEAGKHPFGVIETVLCYNGPNSLKKYLITNGLITSMSFVSDDTSAGSVAYLAFDIPVPARDRMDELLSAVFTYIYEIGEVEKSFIEQLQELRSSLFYSNAESHSIVNEGPMRLSKYFAAQLVTSTRIRTSAETMTKAAVDLIGVNEKILQVDVDIVNSLLRELRVENSVILFHDPSYSRASPPDWVTQMSSNMSSEVTDPHYNFKYMVGAVTTNLSRVTEVSKLSILRKMSVMPPTITKDISIASSRANSTEVSKQPTLVLSDMGVEIWYKPSALAKGLPKVWLWATVRPASAAVDAISPEELQFSGEMLVDSVTFELRSKVAEYIQAGYDFVINWMTAGYFEIKVFGWQDRINELMEIVVTELSNPSLNHFDLILGEKIEAMTRARSMSDIAGEALNSLVVGSPTREDIRTYIDTYSPSKGGLLNWSKTLFKSVFFTIYVGGSAQSYSQDLAVGLGRNLTQVFTKETLLLNRSMAVYFSAGPRFGKPVEVRMVNPSENDPNSALLYSLTYGTDMSSRDRIVAALLASIVDPMVFRYIRTEHQMGYIASGKVGVYPGPAGAVQFRVYIQGNLADPDLMEARLETLLATVPSVIQDISAKEIEERAEGVAASLEEQATSANAEVSRFWSAIHDESACFNRGLNQADFLKSTDPNQLRASLVTVFNEFWKDRRSKATVKIFKSEGSDGDVPAWSKQALAGAAADSPIPALNELESERATTAVINSVTKQNRETVFKTALNQNDPLWTPVIASCDI